MKALSTLVKILASCSLLFILVGGGIMAVTYPYGEPFENMIKDEYKVQLNSSEKFNVENVNKIEVSGDLSINVINSASANEIGVVATGTMFGKRANMDNFSMFLSSDGVLSVKLKSHFYFIWNFFSFHNKVTVDISVPSSYTGELEIDNISKTTTVAADNTFSKVKVDSKAGKVMLSLFKTPKLSADITSGSLSISNVKADYAKIKMTSGETSLSGFKADKIDISATSGKIVGEDLYMDNLTVDMTSGDVNLSLNENANISVTLTSGSCKISAPAPLGYNCSFSITSGKIKNDNYFSGKDGTFTKSTSFSKTDNSPVYDHDVKLTSGSVTFIGK